MTYNVPVGDRELAVSAVTLLPGASITAADLTDAVAKIPIGVGPDIVQVCPEMTLSATYRPTVSALRAAGIPKPGRQAWYFDTDGNFFRKLTPSVRSELSGRRPWLTTHSWPSWCARPIGARLLLVDDELLYNPRLRRAYRIEDGIPVLLVDEARDVDDDEHARLMARGRPADPR